MCDRCRRTICLARCFFRSYEARRGHCALIYSNTGPGISIGGFDSSVGSTSACTIINNTLAQNDSTPNDGSGEFQMQFFPNNGTISKNIFANKVLFANGQGVLMKSTLLNPPVLLDFSLYFTPVGDANSTWQFDGQTYTGFSAYKTNSHQDADSQFANPLFLSIAPPELYVEPTSPAVNKGNCTPSNCSAAIVGTNDQAGFARVQGSAIDIGAYEQ